MRSSKG
jgi:hypothetical protein